jgi:hypothetical protein
MSTDDYMVFYGYEDRIIGVVGPEGKGKEMCYYNEALRLDLMPTVG